MVNQKQFMDKVDEIDKLYSDLVREMPSIVKKHREVFEAKARDFYKKRLEYKDARDKIIDCKAVEAAKTKARQEGGRVHCTTLDNSPESPKDRWELIGTQITEDGLSFGWDFWAPSDFPSNPDDWFNKYKTSGYGVLGNFLNKKGCYPKDELLRDYIAVAVLFNELADECREPLISPEILSDIKIPLEREALICRITSISESERQIWPKIKTAFIDTLEAVKRDFASEQPNDGRTQLSKKVNWNDGNLDYIPSSEAVVKFTDSKMPLPTLSNMLESDGVIRYMRKGQRCKVHIGDFRQWAEQHYPSDKARGEITDDYIADVEARKAKVKEG